jgi:hypothetical protein
MKARPTGTPAAAVGMSTKGTTMIICSKPEANGVFREFVLDDAEEGDKVHVKTHLAHRTDGRVVAEDDWTDAGVITRAPEGLKAAVVKPARRGKPAFVSLDELYTNEIAALQAIAVNYKATQLKN